jgi:CBS domain containing-hemolysin-like protein
MTPLTEMVSIPLTMPFAQILEIVKRERRSRIPVYKGRKSHIVGILLTKDLLRFKARNPPGARQLQRLLQTPYYVPATKTADDLLQEFQRYRTHIAIVVNEHGALSGVVTLDDLLEELVGEMGLDENEQVEGASE